MLSFTDDEDVAPGEMRQNVDGLLRHHINGYARVVDRIIPRCGR